MAGWLYRQPQRSSIELSTFAYLVYSQQSYYEPSFRIILKPITPLPEEETDGCKSKPTDQTFVVVQTSLQSGPDGQVFKGGGGGLGRG